MVHRNAAAEWWPVASGTENMLLAITENNIHSVAVGDYHTVMERFQPGTDWTVNTEVPVTDQLLAVSVVPNGQSDYVLVVGRNGTIIRSPMINAVGPGSATLIPAEFALRAYPNPFNARTNLEFSVPSTGRVGLAVYDITGRLVNTLHDEIMPAGKYVLNYDAAGLSSGTYFVRMNAPSATQTRKLVLIR
jgi:hypothetical protein